MQYNGRFSQYFLLFPFQHIASILPLQMLKKEKKLS